jgi:hypothetical protein
MNATDTYRQAIKRTFSELYSVPPDMVDVTLSDERDTIVVKCAGKTFLHLLSDSNVAPSRPALHFGGARLRLHHSRDVNLTAPVAQEDQDNRANNDSGNPERHTKMAIVIAAATTIRAGRISAMRTTWYGIQ